MHFKNIHMIARRKRKISSEIVPLFHENADWRSVFQLQFSQLPATAAHSPAPSEVHFSHTLHFLSSHQPSLLHC